MTLQVEGDFAGARVTLQVRGCPRVTLQVRG